MREVCQEPLSGEAKDCHEQAGHFLALTGAFGEPAHFASQQASCRCVREGEAAGSEHRRYLQAFLQEYSKASAGDERVQKLLTRWEGHEGELYGRLMRVHGE